MAETPLTLAGRYRLDQIIGRGGMAEVWQGSDLLLGREVAIKRLRADLATDPTFQARFQREAHSAAGLNHPNIVAVYDTGSQVDAVSGVAVPYIVMELVHGRTLRDVLASGTELTPAQALTYTQGVLDALAYSHRRGIVHRDIKPANVMVTPNDSIKVMDFGIARAVSDTSATMTQTAAVIGTAQYLSPEQARGETVDARSDVYSTGCLLYELLTRRPPFIGDSPVSVAYQHVREMPIPPSQLNPAITPPVDAIVMQSLAKSPSDRYQSADDMRDDIARALVGREVQATVPVVTAGTPLEPEPTKVIGGQPPGAAAAAATTGTSPVPLADDYYDDGYDDEPERRRGISVAAIILIVLAVIAVGVVVVLLMKLSPKEPVVQEVTVPTVVNMDEQTAGNTLRLSNLAIDPVYATVGGDVPECTLADKGKVVKQKPLPDTRVATMSPVTITVCQGPATIVIPGDLRGKTQQQAETELRNDYGWTGTFGPSIPATPDNEPIDLLKDQIVTSNPSAGSTIPSSGTITLTIATGESLMPNVVTTPPMTQAEATKALTDKGFTVPPKINWTGPGTAPTDGSGIVQAQSPAANERFSRTEAVTLTVAPPTIPIPGDLVGRMFDQVQSALGLAGFTNVVQVNAGPVCGPNPTPERADSVAGQVLDVSPAPGNQALAGDKITVTIATGQSIVPNVRGLTVSEATNMLNACGFGTITPTTPEHSTEQPADHVIDVWPTVGTSVARNEKVTLRISKGPEPPPSTPPAQPTPGPGGQVVP